MSVASLPGIAVRCDVCKTCLTSPLMLSTNAFIYFKEYKDDEQSLIYPYEGMVETVISSVTVLDGTRMMAGVPYTNSFEENIIAAFKNTVDFGWIQSSGCLLYHHKIVDGIVRSFTRMSIPWWCKQRNRSLMEASRPRATKRKLKILLHT